jgi:ABC-type nickel/cobalt efflux system permease component RcnA
MLAGMLQANNPFLIIIAGLMIGLLHAFEPDHLSAVSTQLLRNNDNSKSSKKQDLRNLTIISSLRGALWGMGHTSSIILIGLLIAGLSLNIPDDFFISAEVLVGLMLITLAIFTFTNKSIFKQKHVHPHTHSDGISHTHSHEHNENHKHGHKAYLIGCVHGIAGSGSLVALFASTMNGFDMMIYFLILFGIGSIIGMSVASGVMGLPFILLSKVNSITKYLRYTIASITFIIGLNIIITIGLDNKLFSLN